MEETLEGTFAMIKPDAVGKKTFPYKNRTTVIPRLARFLWQPKNRVR